MANLINNSTSTIYIKWEFKFYPTWYTKIQHKKKKEINIPEYIARKLELY